MKKSVFNKNELFILTGFDLNEKDFLKIKMCSEKVGLFKFKKIEPVYQARTDDKQVQAHQKEGSWFKASLGEFKYI